MKPRSSKAKGRAGENEVADLLSKWGFNGERNPKGSWGDEDVTHAIPDVLIEVKRQERLNVPAAFRQAEAAAERHGRRQAWVVHRSNNQPWLVTMRFEDLMHHLSSGPCA